MAVNISLMDGNEKVTLSNPLCAGKFGYIKSIRGGRVVLIFLFLVQVECVPSALPCSQRSKWCYFSLGS